MELIENIFFNTDKLVENSKIKIIYDGNLAKNNSSDVFIHYGFGLQWDNLNDLKMEKTELGFKAEVNILEGDSFNFCFRNSDNIWDNNNYTNYIVPIEKCEKALIVTEFSENSMSNYKPLRKSYLFKKKVKIAFLRAIAYIPKFLNVCKSKLIKDNL